MIRYVLLAALAFACLGVADTRAALVNGTSADGFVWRDGFWWRNKVAYSRSRGPACYGCRARFVYRRAAAVVINNNVVTPQSPDWKIALTKYKAQLADNQDFLQALGTLGPSYAQSRVQSYSYGNGGQFGYSSAASLYGDSSPALLFQQSARLAESAQGYGADATAAFADLVGLDAAGRARAAEIVAAGQAVSQARSGGVQVQVQSGAQSVPTPPAQVPGQLLPGTPLPQDRPAPGAIGALPSSAQTCAQCHAAGKESAGGGFAFLDAKGQARKNTALELLNISARVHLPPEDPKAMPPARAGKPLTDEGVGEWEEWIAQRANELKASK